MRELLKDPAWTAADLGMPLPDCQHAVSVCLPTWDSIIGYEEGLSRITGKMQCGYPRFFRHPSISRLFSEAEKAVCEPHEAVVVFPHVAAAQRAHGFVEKRIPGAARISSYQEFQCLVIPKDAFKVAMEYWRYTGEIVSSRRAFDFFNGLSPASENHLLAELAKVFCCPADSLFLYENGMSAVFAAFRAITELRPNLKTLQLEFPYVDVLKIQQHFGSGVVYLNKCEGKAFEEALQRIENSEFSAVFCEIPSNPLLRSVDLARISQACRKGGVILVVDDTICSHYNVNVEEFADIITTSLTKWLSGKGDVMGGAIRLSPNSPHFEGLKAFLLDDNPSQSHIYEADSQALCKNIKGFESRMEKVNHNGLQLAHFLYKHPSVDQVWYPFYETSDLYQSLLKKGGGYGGLISFTLKDSGKAPEVYDKLRLSKGPSLGTEFSLVCPYTLLAHYDELDWVEKCGVPSNLIRLSVGIETLQELQNALEQALSFA